MKRVVAAALVLALTAVAAPAAAAAEDTFRNGTSTATAQILRIAPGVGGLELATSLGSVASQVTNALAQAKATAIDLGIIGTTLTAEGCDGDPGAFTPDQLPQSLVVDNRARNAAASAAEVPSGAAVVSGGRTSASATTETPPGRVTGSPRHPRRPRSRRSRPYATRSSQTAREAWKLLSTSTSASPSAQNAQWRAVHRTGAKRRRRTFSCRRHRGACASDAEMQPLQDSINLRCPDGITLCAARRAFTNPNDSPGDTAHIQHEGQPLGHTALAPSQRTASSVAGVQRDPAATARRLRAVSATSR